MELPLFFFLLLRCLLLTSAQSSDAVALLALKSNFKDPTGVLSSWNSTTPHCRWHGISCNSSTNPGRVTSIELESLSLAGTISPAVSNLTFLAKLHLPNNTLSGSIPPELGRIRTLLNLNLSLNLLEGPIPDSLGGCLDLQGLSLRNNHLQGVIPANISNCKKLKILSLWDNRLEGEIPPELGGLESLEQLYLQRNNLTGEITPFLGNLTSLTELKLQYNNFRGGIPPELNKLRSLLVLDLLFNRLSGEVPPALYNFSEVYGFGLGGNLLEGKLPPDFGKYLPKVHFLFLYQNQFEGSIPASIANASFLETLDLSNNSFTGVVPPVFRAMPNLTRLLLGGNQFVAKDSNDWRFMDSLTSCRSLELIDLSDNRFAGSFPRAVVNLSDSIFYLDVANNSISGQIPEGITNLKNLQTLGMGTNLLTGTIPETIGQVSQLQGLFFKNNSLSGLIPESIGNITTLVELTLSLNRLTGSIPESLAKLQLLNVLDLSYNNLTGGIPKSLFTLSSLTLFLNISNNLITGPLPDQVGNLKNLQALDVSQNHLQGAIPGTLGQCSQLFYLQLGANSFNGSIPQSFSNLKTLKMLNLSHNNLSGQIPVFLTKMDSLNYLDLSFNDLEGEVPRTGVFANSSMFSLAGNAKLCGGIPELNLGPCNYGGGKDGGKKNLAVIIGVSASAAVVCLVLMVCIYQRCLQAGRPEKILPTITALKFGKESVSYQELHKATDGFSSANLVGSGSYGSVYRASLSKFKKMVAIKVLNCEQQGALSGFMAECKILRNIRHRNLVRVLTACSTADHNGAEFKALIYEYMPNGSLDSWLHGSGELRFLGLRRRVGIVNDVALALDYLHYQGETPVVHSDLKPSNILLDEDMTAHVGDFGLARFLNKNANAATGNTSTVAIKGTVGYIPPEYGMGSPVSIQGDLYSFGILILEMLTGKRPTDEWFQNGMSIHNYVQGSYPDNIQDIIDPGLLEEEDSRVSKEESLECMEMMVGIGLACSQEAPYQRMNSKDVLKQLAAIKGILGEHKS